MTREETARNNHKQGFNCAQAVALAFADKFGTDKNVLFAMTEGFGLGGGNMQGTCGALAAAYMVSGMLNSSGNTEDRTTKKKTYSANKELAKAFAELSGGMNCYDLKGVKTGKILCECNDCVGYAARVLAKYLGEEA